jgi:glycosyltransferase involved in cell wall biosynthesis
MCALLSSWIPARIIVCANRAAQVHAGIGYNVSKMVVVPNGCDTTRFMPNSQSRYRLRREWGVDERMALIGMVARFDLQKDHANLFGALHLVNQSGSIYKCILVGVSMDEANVDLMDLIEKAGLKGNVILLGGQTDIPAIMNALDYTCCPAPTVRHSLMLSQRRWPVERPALPQTWEIRRVLWVTPDGLYRLVTRKRWPTAS